MNNYVFKNLLLSVCAIILSITVVGGTQYLLTDKHGDSFEKSNLEATNQQFKAKIGQLLGSNFNFINFLTSTSYPTVAVDFDMDQQLYSMIDRFSQGSEIQRVALFDSKAEFRSQRNLAPAIEKTFMKTGIGRANDGAFYFFPDFVVYSKPFFEEGSPRISGWLAGVIPIATIEASLAANYHQAMSNFLHLSPAIRLRFPVLTPQQIRNHEKSDLSQVEVDFSYTNPITEIFHINQWNVILGILFCSLVIFGSTFMLRNSLKEPVKELHAIVRFLASDADTPYTGTLPKDLIFRKVAASLLSMHSQRTALEQEVRKREVDKKMSEIASQVAHDIRSPLAALGAIEKDLCSLDEEKRLMVRSAVNRIKDIANNLLITNRTVTENPSAQQDSVEKTSTLLLPALIEPLITEKRLQYRSKIGLDLDFQMNKEAYGLFASVKPTEFKRVISNLINNAVEALGQKGSVALELTGNTGKIEIKISDNGKGIPDDILPTLGHRGTSYEKEGGSGFGLFHARTSLESWGGSFRIESAKDKGTTVILTLPITEAPAWFMKEITIEPHSTIVVLDDDSSIHQIWRGRFEALKVTEADLSILHFSTPAEIRAWVNQRHPNPTLFLIDHEFLGHKETGTSLIEELSLHSQSVLVTSRFEEKLILEKCSSLGVRMIPKGMAGFVPISLMEARRKFDAVLIDDDDLVHYSWRESAKGSGIAISQFGTLNEFLFAAPTIAHSTPIYIDSNLGNGVRGEEISKQISEMGFEKVYLATGYNPEHFPAMPWLAGIIGKVPPWIETSA